MMSKKRPGFMAKERVTELAQALERQLDRPGGDLPACLALLLGHYAAWEGRAGYDWEAEERARLLLSALEDMYPIAIGRAEVESAFSKKEGVNAVLGLLLIHGRYIEPVPKTRAVVPSWADVARYLNVVSPEVVGQRLPEGFPPGLRQEVLWQAGALLREGGSRASTEMVRCKRAGFESLAWAIVEMVEADGAPVYSQASMLEIPLAYLERPGLMADLTRLVEAVQRGSEPVMVLGESGTGKTTLLKAYGRSVRQAGQYPDGVFFFTLGEQPLLVKHLRHLIARVGKQVLPDVGDAEEIAPCLQSVLLDKRVLILLDDVHRPEDARHFLVGGPGCRVVVSSRNQRVADRLVSRDRWLTVGGLEPEEAEALSQRLLGTDTWRWSEDDCEGLKELGRLAGLSPLLLETLIPWLPEMGWDHLLANLREKLWEPSSYDMAGWESDINAALRVGFDALGERRDWLLRLAAMPQASSFGVDAAAALYGVSKSEAAERLALLVKHHLLKVVDEPGFGDHRYRMHGLVLRCIRCEAKVNVEDKQTFAWMGRHRGALFDRSGWLLPILASPAWWETKPWKRYWWLAPKSIESNFFNRILRPYREFVKQLWKRDGTYVPFEVRATAYQLGQRRGPLRLVSYLGAPILLLVAGGLWFWVETWVRDLVARRGILFPQHVPLVLGLIAGLLVLLVGSWPLLAYGLSWLKFIHRYVHGYVSEGEEPQ